MAALIMLVVTIISACVMFLSGASATQVTGQRIMAPPLPAAPAWEQPEQNTNRIAVPMLAPCFMEAPLLLVAELPPAPQDGTTCEVPGLGQVTWGYHATAKHGKEALLARAAAMVGGLGSFWHGHDDRRNCEKVYSINQILEHVDGRVVVHWALVIFDAIKPGVYMEVSSYISDDHDYVLNAIERDGCANPYQMTHP